MEFLASSVSSFISAIFSFFSTFLSFFSPDYELLVTLAVVLLLLPYTIHFHFTYDDTVQVCIRAIVSAIHNTIVKQEKEIKQLKDELNQEQAELKEEQELSREVTENFENIVKLFSISTENLIETLEAVREGYIPSPQSIEALRTLQNQLETLRYRPTRRTTH
jgi:ABC-type multidrug transport system fused ATPase/permease subunit